MSGAEVLLNVRRQAWDILPHLQFLGVALGCNSVKIPVMRVSLRHPPVRFAAITARLALALALVLAAFAHRPASPTPSGMSVWELAQYVLPDGSLPSLCLPGEEHRFGGHHCEFCLIAGAVLPPDRPGAPSACPHLIEIGVSRLVPAGPPVCPACLATSPLRGPPAATV